MSKIDLHIHSTYSDGKLTPKEIINEATKNNVKTIAIADHDTIEAYTKDLFEYAKNNNIKLIPAVEISTKASKVGIHILGYNIDINNELLKDKLKKLRNARHDYLYKVANKLKELGYTINIEELDKIDSVTKAHIAEQIVKNKNNEKLLQKVFDHIPTKGEFIETIMNENCPAYVKKESITPKEASTLIREANGKVILAHPVAYTYEDDLSDEEIINIIKDINADGIESKYIYIDRNHNIINDINKWDTIARELNLFTTIGSDFHNYDKYHPPIGLTNDIKNINVEEIINNITN